MRHNPPPEITHSTAKVSSHVSVGRRTSAVGNLLGEDDLIATAREVGCRDIGVQGDRKACTTGFSVPAKRTAYPERRKKRTRREHLSASAVAPSAMPFGAVSERALY